jgi:raffinose/stachyose/melibiose transport system permease protein
MIPIYTVLVPLLRLIKNLGLINSHWGLIVVYIATGLPFAIFMLTGFVRSIPNEIIEASVVDGCSVYRLFWVIIFPLLKPAVTTLFILDFLGIWNDFLLPMLTLTQNSMKTVTVAMYSFYGEYGTRWEMTFAAYTLAIIPIVIVYMFLQKNIVNGIMLGAVKG